MSAPEPVGDNLSAWLDYIGSVHLTEIELGLDRVGAVANRLGISRPAPIVVTVAGTNGKGSVVGCLEAALTACGFKTGTYTSPHIHRFNERIRLGAEPMSNDSIVRALAAVDSARVGISLSYFEFATLAALWLFQREAVDIAILEVGLGGRLDAVNLIDPDVSVITSIDLDHQEWLGNDRESIAMEKAGILRAGKAFVCADASPPQCLLDRAAELSCPSYLLGQDFDLQLINDHVCWQGRNHDGNRITLDGFSAMPLLARANVAAAIQVLQLLPLELDLKPLVTLLQGLGIPGRQEWCLDRQTRRKVLLDVAHNPAACALLAETLTHWRATAAIGSRVIAVVGVMADKDIQDMAHNLESSTDIWYIAELAVPRSMRSGELETQLKDSGFTKPIQRFDTIEQAYETACAGSEENDLVVVTGSFYTVAALRESTRAERHPMEEAAA
jgi:dihydrofolate synthase/folylpolyglutamate synthase